jgi:hypothetical protein
VTTAAGSAVAALVDTGIFMFLGLLVQLFHGYPYGGD